EVPEPGKQPFADEPAQNGVAQKLQSFVIRAGDGRRGYGFVRARTVGNRAGQQPVIGKTIAERLLELVQIRLHYAPGETNLPGRERRFSRRGVTCRLWPSAGSGLCRSARSS